MTGTGRTLPVAAHTEVELPTSADSAGRARQFVAETLLGWQFTRATVADAKLIVSELATNAVQHAGGSRFWLRCDLTDASARISVGDNSRTLPVRILSPSADSEGGRGIALIEATATRWGVALEDEGKVVWAEVHRPDTPPPSDSPKSPAGAPEPCIPPNATPAACAPAT